MIHLPNGFQQTQGLIEGLAGFFGVFFGVTSSLIVAFGVLSYVLESLGTYTIARRRGIYHSWLAWIPVGRAWLLGSVSDQYQYIVKNQRTTRRRVLLWLNVALLALPAAVTVVGISAFLTAPDGGAVYGAWLAIVILCNLVALAMRVVALVFRYIALYDLYRSCDPDNALLYLLFSIVLSVTMPFFVFACRERDGGMPQRRSAPEEEPVSL